MYESSAASGATSLLQQPIVRAFAGLGVLLVAERAIEEILFGLFRWLDVGTSLLFDQLWNLDQVRWLAIAITVVGWLVVASKLEPFTLWLALASYLFVAVVLENVLFDLPDPLIDLYLVLAPALLLPAVAYAIAALWSARPESDALTTSTSVAPPVMSFASPAINSPDPAGHLDAVQSAPNGPAEGPGSEPAWLPDPRGVAQLRWWDGANWTDHTHNG